MTLTHAPLAGPGSTPEVSYAPSTEGVPPFGNPLTAALAGPLAGSPGHTSEARDGVAPTPATLIGSAETLSETETAVSFGEAMSAPTLVPADWTVAGAPAAEIVPNDGFALLVHPPTGGTAATPEVVYTVPGAGAVLADAAGNALALGAGLPAPAGTSVAETASDGAPPVPRASFAGPMTIEVTFGEALREAASAVEALAWAVSTPAGPVTLSGSPEYDAASRTLTITLAAAADEAAAYTVAVPARSLADARGNYVSEDPVAELGARGTHFRAVTLGSTQTLVTFSPRRHVHRGDRPALLAAERHRGAPRRGDCDGRRDCRRRGPHRAPWLERLGERHVLCGHTGDGNRRRGQRARGVRGDGVRGV